MSLFGRRAARSSWTAPGVGGIFVVRTADGVVVKRLGKDEAGGWQLVSDHPSWEPTPWPDEAALIGEVKWMARTL